MRLSRILVPTDFSAHADAAAEVALALAAASGGTLALVHVYSVPSVMLPDGSTFVAPPAELAAIDEHAEASLAEGKRRLEARAGAVPVSTQAIIGSPVDELLRLAESGDYDVLVMGSHGRGGVRRLLVGSVAESVSRRSPIPVITVREPHGAAATASPPP